MPPPILPLLFVPAAPRPATLCNALPGNANDTIFQVTLTPGDRSFATDGTLTLLQAAELAGMAMLASSCRNGTCRTCICHLSRGRVAYRIEWPGLSADEKREGFILPCVAFAQTDLVIALPF